MLSTELTTVTNDSKRPERRIKPRIQQAFPTTVKGVDASGVKFQSNTLPDNISAHGMYLRLASRVEIGTKLSFVVRLSVNQSSQASASRVAIQGEVLRVDDIANNIYGIAVRFTHHWFLRD